MKIRFVFLLVLLLGLIAECSTLPIREDIKEQIMKTEEIAVESKTVSEKTTEAASAARQRGTPEGNRDANIMQTCAEQLSKCTKNSLDESASLKNLAKQAEELKNKIESMQFFYKLGMGFFYFSCGMVAMAVLYLIGRFWLKLSFLI